MGYCLQHDTAQVVRYSSPTVMYYYGYRYYEPGTGRWVSRDPIGERGGKNLYRFIENKPIDLLDVLGRDPFNPGGISSPQTGSRSIDESESSAEKRRREEWEAAVKKIHEDIEFENNLPRISIDHGGSCGIKKYKKCGSVYSRVFYAENEVEATDLEKVQHLILPRHWWLKDPWGNTYSFPGDQNAAEEKPGHETTKYIGSIIIPEENDCKSLWSCIKQEFQLNNNIEYNPATNNCQQVATAAVKKCGGELLVNPLGAKE